MGSQARQLAAKSIGRGKQVEARVAPEDHRQFIPREGTGAGHQGWDELRKNTTAFGEHARRRERSERATTPKIRSSSTLQQAPEHRPRQAELEVQPRAEAWAESWVVDRCVQLDEAAPSLGLGGCGRLASRYRGCGRAHKGQLGSEGEASRPRLRPGWRVRGS